MALSGVPVKGEAITTHSMVNTFFFFWKISAENGFDSLCCLSMGFSLIFSSADATIAQWLNAELNAPAERIAIVLRHRVSGTKAYERLVWVNEKPIEHMRRANVFQASHFLIAFLSKNGTRKMGAVTCYWRVSFHDYVL